MPVALVGVAYAGYGGYALWAGASGMAMVSAGMMVAGGAATLVGNATGDKNLTETGLLVGAVGSIGLTVSGGVPGKPDIPANNTESFKQSISGNPVNMSGVKDTALPGSIGTNTVSGIPAASTGSNASIEALFLKSQAAMEKTAMTNMMVQTGAGALQGLATYQTGQENKKAMDEQLAEKRRLEERDYANRNNLTSLKVQTPTNLPNMQKVAQQRGLIGAPSTLQVQG